MLVRAVEDLVFLRHAADKLCDMKAPDLGAFVFQLHDAPF